MKLTRNDMERLLYAVHNHGYGADGGPDGESWDNGATAVLNLLFPPQGVKNSKSLKQ